MLVFAIVGSVKDQSGSIHNAEEFSNNSALFLLIITAAFCSQMRTSVVYLSGTYVPHYIFLLLAHIYIFIHKFRIIQLKYSPALFKIEKQQKLLARTNL